MGNWEGSNLVVECWSSKPSVWVRFLPPLFVIPKKYYCTTCRLLNMYKQNGVIVIRRAHDPKMLVRFQLLLSGLKSNNKECKNHAFKEKYIAHKWQNLSKLVIITQSVEYPFVVRKVSGSIPLNYPKGNNSMVEYRSPKLNMWVQFLLPLLKFN